MHERTRTILALCAALALSHTSKGDPAAVADIGGFPAPLYQQWEAYVLNEHNLVRAGILTEERFNNNRPLWPGGSKPAPLPDLSWDDELASLARTWAFQCSETKWEYPPKPDPNQFRRMKVPMPTIPLEVPEGVGSYYRIHELGDPGRHLERVEYYAATPLSTDADYDRVVRRSLKMRSELPGDHSLHIASVTDQLVASETASFREEVQQEQRELVQLFSPLEIPRFQPRKECHESGLHPGCDSWQQAVSRSTTHLGCATALCSKTASYGDTLYRTPLLCLYRPGRGSDSDRAPYTQ